MLQKALRERSGKLAELIALDAMPSGELQELGEHRIHAELPSGPRSGVVDRMLSFSKVLT
jgi:hypothetical protein